MEEDIYLQQIESAKADESKLLEATQSFTIDESLHERFRQLEEQTRSLEIEFQTLLNTRRK